MNNILIINPFGIGDVLFTTPVVRCLRAAYPQARLTYLANRRTAPLLAQNQDISEVLVYERDEFYAVYKKNPLAFWKKWRDFVGQIQKERFDAVFDFSLNSTFGFIAWYCRIPKRIGYDYRGRGRLLTHRLPLKGYEGRHVVEYYLDLLKMQGIATDAAQHLELRVPETELQWARDWLKVHGVPGKRLVAVVPGGGASWGKAAKNKRWRADKYAHLVDKIVADSKATVILMGDKAEHALAQEIDRLVHSPIVSAVGQTSVMQMAALMQNCCLAVLNDGGPLHVAVAAGTKTVGIFGPVDPHVYGPWPASGHEVVRLGLPCQPCYRQFRMADCGHINCLQALSVEDVWKKVQPHL